MEAIILAGGFGTRLQSVVSDVPKCMAPVAGHPFLHHLLDSLERAGFRRIILSLGYKHEIVEEWLRKEYHTRMKITTVVEDEPLGTGGAVKLAATRAKDKSVFILNGDTYFEVDYSGIARLHQLTGAQATLALRKMEHFDRYGIVDLDPDSFRITGFREKQPCEEGYINGGVYLVDREQLATLPDKCSLEKDYFEPRVHTAIFTGFAEDGYFIDIGIPDDYARIQEDFKSR